MSAHSATCAACHETYSGSVEGPTPLDLRPNEPLTVLVPATIGGPGPALGEMGSGPLVANPAGPRPRGVIPRHLSEELVSWIPEPSSTGALALDLGCGDGQNRELLEAAGYAYVAVDFENPAAMIFADAHRLPFADASFDLVISIAVLEHLHTPSLAMSEVRRVLTPGRSFVGTVAFLEPFHARSYYHHTSLGTLNSVVAGGLEPRMIAASPGWSVFDAQAKTWFKGAPRWIRPALHAVTTAGHRTWWWIGRRLQPAAFSRSQQAIAVAGSWAFVADAPSSRDPEGSPLDL